jgi:hypothetical protein
LPIFEISPLNIQFLKGEIIPVTSLRRARSTGTFHTWSPNLSRSVMKMKIRFPGNYSQYHAVYIRNRNIFVFSISRDYISLQAPCQILVDRLACLESPIYHSVNSDIQIHCTYLSSHTVGLQFIFISFWNIFILLAYGHSGFAIELSQPDNHYAF